MSATMCIYGSCFFFFLAVCSPFFLSFHCLSQIVLSLCPLHGTLLRGLINHSRCLSVTSLVHTCITCIHTTVLVTQGKLVPSMSVLKSLTVKKMRQPFEWQKTVFPPRGYYWGFSNLSQCVIHKWLWCFTSSAQTGLALHLYLSYNMQHPQGGFFCCFGVTV